MLGSLAALSTGLSLALFLRSRNQPSRVYRLRYAVLSAGAFVV